MVPADGGHLVLVRLCLSRDQCHAKLNHNYYAKMRWNISLWPNTESLIVTSPLPRPSYELTPVPRPVKLDVAC